MNMVAKKNYATIKSTIPNSSSEASSPELAVEDIAATPTIISPITIQITPAKWCLYCFLFKKIIENKQQIATMDPRIIWYTEGGVITSPKNVRVEPHTSHDAGIARNRGLMLFFTNCC